MGRIRSLKPEFCQSEAIAALSIAARLHFAMLWTYADDEGRGIDNPRLIKAALWPLDDDMTADRVEALQVELCEHGRLERYEVDGRRYFQVVNWSEHQHPQKKSTSKLPPPSDGAPVVVRDESRNGQGELPPVVVGEGRCRGEVEEPSPAAPVARVRQGDFEAFWELYPRKVGKGEARKAFARAVKRAGSTEPIMDGMRRLGPAMALLNKRYQPHPTTWLNRDGWEDDPPPVDEPKNPNRDAVLAAFSDLAGAQRDTRRNGASHHRDDIHLAQPAVDGRTGQDVAGRPRALGP